MQAARKHKRWVRKNRILMKQKEIEYQEIVKKFINEKK